MSEAAKPYTDESVQSRPAAPQRPRLCDDCWINIRAAGWGDTADLAEQIKRLADFIMFNVPGEPSQSEGAVDTAIRLLGDTTALREERDGLRNDLRRAVNERDDRGKAVADYQHSLGQMQSALFTTRARLAEVEAERDREHDLWERTALKLQQTEVAYEGLVTAARAVAAKLGHIHRDWLIPETGPFLAAVEALAPNGPTDGAVSVDA